MHLEIQDSASAKPGGLVPQARDKKLMPLLERAIGPLAATRLVESVGLSTVLRLGVSDLSSIGGVAERTAERFIAMRDFMRGALARRGHMNSAEDVVAALPPGLALAEVEMLFAIAIDGGYSIKNVVMVAKGSVSQAAVSPRDVFVPMLRASASAILIAHNHPGTGDPNPSKADVALTNTISRIGYLLGVPLLDHVIVASRGTFSFSEAGLLLSDKELQATTMNLRASGGAS